jgi:hypothetical protein
MSIAGTSFRVLALLLLLFLGWAAIGALHLLVVSHNVPVIPLGFGRVITDSWNQGFVAADGTWTIDGEKHAFPLNTSEIRCFKENSVCYGAQAQLSDNYLAAYLEFYKITKWDDSTLEFVEDASCVSYVYVINRSVEKLTGRRVAKTTDDPTCQLTERSDLRLSFVSGSEVVDKLRSEYASTIQSTVLATAWATFILFLIWRVARKPRATSGFT